MVAALISTRSAAARIFGDESLANRQRVILMIKTGDLAGWRRSQTRKAPWWISSASLEQFLAGVNGPPDSPA